MAALPTSRQMQSFYSYSTPFSALTTIADKPNNLCGPQPISKMNCGLYKKAPQASNTEYAFLAQTWSVAHRPALDFLCKECFDSPRPKNVPEDKRIVSPCRSFFMNLLSQIDQRRRFIVLGPTSFA